MYEDDRESFYSKDDDRYVPPRDGRRTGSRSAPRFMGQGMTRPTSLYARRRANSVNWIAVIITCILLSVIGLTTWYFVYHANDPTHGTVTSKPYHYGYWTSQCVAYNKYGSCTVSIPIYQQPTYQICFHRDPGDTEHNPNGCVYVDEHTYGQYIQGDHYPRVATTPSN